MDQQQQQRDKVLGEWVKTDVVYPNGSEAVESVGDDANTETSSFRYFSFNRARLILHGFFGSSNVRRPRLLYGKGSVCYVLKHKWTGVTIAIGSIGKVLRIWTTGLDNQSDELDAVGSLWRCLTSVDQSAGTTTRSRYRRSVGLMA